LSYPVNYEAKADYSELPGWGLAPAIEVVLRHGTSQAAAVALLDTGSTYTVFQPAYAELLGIEDVTSGRRDAVSTAGGVIDVYLFDLELDVRIGTQIYTFPGQVAFTLGHIPRNLLGLNILFQQFQIGFHDSRQTMYLLRDNQTLLFS